MSVFSRVTVVADFVRVPFPFVAASLSDADSRSKKLNDAEKSFCHVRFLCLRDVAPVPSASATSDWPTSSEILFAAP